MKNTFLWIIKQIWLSIFYLFFLILTIWFWQTNYFWGFVSLVVMIMWIPYVKNFIFPFIYNDFIKKYYYYILSWLWIIIFIISIVSSSPKPEYKIISNINWITWIQYNLEIWVSNMDIINIFWKDYDVKYKTGLIIPITLDKMESDFDIKYHWKLENLHLSRIPITEKEISDAKVIKDEQIKEDIKSKIEKDKVQKELSAKQELEEQKTNPEKYLEIIKSNRRMDWFWTVWMLDITIKNNSSFDYKDISITQTYYSKSKTEIWSKNHDILDIIPSWKTKTFKNINMWFVNSQASSSRTKINFASVYWIN